MPEFLQADLAIGYVDEDGQVKATPYFEDLLFGYLEQMGGENTNLIDNSINNITTLPSTLEVKISQNQKSISDLVQLVETLRRPAKEDLEPRVSDLEQRNIVPIVKPVESNRIDDLEQQVSVLASRNALLKIILSGIKEFTVIELATGDTAHTTTGNEIIICNNTGSATITLRANATDKEEVHIIRKDGAVSFISSAGINGDTTAIPILSAKGAPHLIYTVIASEYSII